MSKMLKKYKARIFGEVYTIISDEDDGFVLEVVSKVDATMKEIASKSTMVDAKQIAVLAALKATEELLLTQQQMRQEQLQSEKIMMLLNNEEITL